MSILYFILNILAGMYEWERVASTYNQCKPERAPDRDHESIRNRFKYLKAVKKPTGDPTCPPLVARAKRIQRLIENGCGVINLDSNSEIGSPKSDIDWSSQSATSHSDESQPGTHVHLFPIALSPIARREQLDGIVPETLETNVVAESLVSWDSQALIADAQGPSISSDEEQFVSGGGSAAGPSSHPATSARLLGVVSNASHKVPHRLGAGSEKLIEIMHDTLGKKRNKHRDTKKNIPENPTHSKKKTIAKELQEIDDEFEKAQARHEQNFALQQQALEYRHQEEMRRLEQQNIMQERRFELEGQRHQALMLVLFSAISGNRVDLSSAQVQSALGGAASHSTNPNP